MAFISQDTVAGIAIDAYIKIDGTDVREEGKFPDESKKYMVLVYLNFYNQVNGEKIHYKQELEVVRGLAESDLTLSTIYGKIMELEKFTGSIFA